MTCDICGGPTDDQAEVIADPDESSGRVVYVCSGCIEGEKR